MGYVYGWEKTKAEKKSYTEEAELVSPEARSAQEEEMDATTNRPSEI